MKIRTNFVSNSSSSSFILKNKDDIQFFNKIFPSNENVIYEVNQIRETIKFFIKDYVNTFDFSKEVDEEAMWNKYFANKVPKYFQYNYVDYMVFNYFNFSSLIELMKNLPESGYITEPYDRDVAYSHLPEDIETFEADL